MGYDEIKSSLNFQFHVKATKRRSLVDEHLAKAKSQPTRKAQRKHTIIKYQVT